MEKSFVTGIDIGGQSTKSGVVDAQGNIIVQTVFNSVKTKDVKEYMQNLRLHLEKLFADPRVGGKDKIKGIGIGAPNGNYYKGAIEYAPNVKWAMTPEGKPGIVKLKDLVEAMFGIPTVVTNDANAAANGEMIYGAAKGMKNFIMLTLGTGVGGGVVIDGKIVYGHDGFAGELGHMTVIRPNGRPCNCGKFGCLETYASATGVARTAREMLESTDEPSLLRNLPADEISSKDVFDAAVQGDKMAIDIFAFTGKILGEACADFVSFSAPEAIILFGGLTKSRRFIEQPMQDAMNANLLRIWKNKIPIKYSCLKDADAAILGASALAWEL